MSLILLFLPHNQGPIPPAQGAFTPGVLQAIETLKPTLIFVETSRGVFTSSTIPYSSSANTYNSGLYGGAMESLPQAALVFAIDTVKPSLVVVDEAQGQFTVSTVEYSSATNTYNSGLYGGADQVKTTPPVVYSIDTLKPKMYKLGKI